ncbi:MAG: 2-oxo acid dehydrogenase subunit E2 [Dehalococcoidia bacterium]|nr:2-oxo acid dehydrogenase subunit E2 [Dehalococcoidia bacterium]
MATEVVVPSFGLGWTTGRIAHWYSPDGATVSAGEPVLCVESDHVTFDVEAEADGVVRHRASRSEMGAGEVLALILAPGERLPERTPPEGSFELGVEEAFARDEAILAAAAVEPAVEEACAEHTTVVDWTGGESADGDEFDFASALPTGDAESDNDADLDDEMRVLPLRRQTLPEPPPVVDDDSPWAPVIGDDLRVSEEWTPEANVADDEWAAGELYVSGEPPVKDPRESASDYFDIAPLADGVMRAEDLTPSNSSSPETPFEDECDLPVSAEAQAVTPVVQYVRVRADMREVRKMRAQLAREWHPVEPHDEDVFVRAVGRVLMEADLPDSVALVVPEREGLRSTVLAGGSSTPFRAAVEALAEGWDAPFESPHAFDIVSFAEWGIDEGVPELRDGRPLAVAVGAVREWAVVDGDQAVPTPMATLTLAYDPAAVTAGQAAWFLARVRELLEAPYALLAA